MKMEIKIGKTYQLIRNVELPSYSIYNGEYGEIYAINDTYIKLKFDNERYYTIFHSDFDFYFKEIESFKDLKKEIKTDPIVGSVITKYLERSSVGIQKYGTTLEENNKDNFLKHLQEELMDASLYVEKLMSKKEYSDITDKVLEWADKRNLLHINNCYRQYSKLQEESNELYIAMLEDNHVEIVDALGDIGVVMIILSNQLGYDFFECIEKAYEVIKNRKGKTINGTFVKE